MIIFDKEDKLLALQNMEELRDEILAKLGEIEMIIDQVQGENRMILTRAKSYWLTSVENNLHEDSGSFLGSMVNFSDTMKELREMVDQEES